MIVHYYGGTAEAAGTSEETVDLTIDMPSEQVLKHLQERHPRLEQMLGVCSLFVDGSAVQGERMVPAEAQVDILPPFAGG